VIEFAQALGNLFAPGYRYKVFAGGRGGAKSWQFARALILLSLLKKIRIGCFRELQNSIKDSVHQILREQIDLMGLSRFFEITDKAIRCTETGSDFIFKGLRSNAVEIKSTEGIGIAWVEEAQLVSKDSWEILVPTIRKENSEIWVSFNPIAEDDPTYERFIKRTPPKTIQQWVNWEANPFFSEALNRERLWMQRSDPDAYEHVWCGGCRKISDDIIFRNKYVVDVFEAPKNPSPYFYYGADFGYANDPATLVRCYITGTGEERELWIDYEAWGVGVDFLDLPEMYDRIPDSRRWKIHADNSQPGLIALLANAGFMIEPAEKWTNNVEDGISYLRSFKQIHIHQRCTHMLQEARLYAWKRNRLTGDVVAEVLDKNNHMWDALRYSLDGIIHKSGLAIWARL
jgi:phage terminase large subunit